MGRLTVACICALVVGGFIWYVSGLLEIALIFGIFTFILGAAAAVPGSDDTPEAIKYEHYRDGR